MGMGNLSVYSLWLDSDDAKDATESMGVLSLDENQEVYLLMLGHF